MWDEAYKFIPVTKNCSTLAYAALLLPLTLHERNGQLTNEKINDSK